MKQLILILLAINAIASQTTVDLSDEDRFIPMERCGDLPLCLKLDDLERNDELCEGSVELVTVPSRVCMNGVVHCRNNAFAGNCLAYPNKESAPVVECDVAKACYHYTTLSVDPPTSTEPATTPAFAPGDECTLRGRVPIVGNCTTYLECSQGYYTERQCLEGYIFYEPLSVCLPGDGQSCQLYVV